MSNESRAQDFVSSCCVIVSFLLVFCVFIVQHIRYGQLLIPKMVFLKVPLQ